MRSILIILLYLSSFNTFSSEQIINPFICCLGQEEARLHKKNTTGPTYLLNKLLIDELTAFNKIHLKYDYLKKICYSNSSKSPSVTFLKYLMLEGKNIFKIYGNKNKILKINTKSTINDFIDKSPHIFLDWISEIQAKSPSHNCLDKYIPELKLIKIKIQYLEAELGITQIFDDKELIKTIFSKLDKLKSFYKKCKQDQRKREQDLRNGKLI